MLINKALSLLYWNFELPRITRIAIWISGFFIPTSLKVDCEPFGKSQNVYKMLKQIKVTYLKGCLIRFLLNSDTFTLTNDVGITPIDLGLIDAIYWYQLILSIVSCISWNYILPITIMSCSTGISLNWQNRYMHSSSMF